MTWQDDVLTLSAIYLMVERGRKFPLYPTTEDDRNAAYVFKLMDQKGMVRPVGTEWQVTELGREALVRAIKAQDILRQLEIFSAVDVTRNLTADEARPEDSTQVLEYVWDPRFSDALPEAHDMRLAVITWLGQVINKKEVSPHTIIFLQKLGSGQFSVADFWSNIYGGFAEVEAIVISNYRWTDMAPEDLELAKQRMQALYTAGTIEQQKREGSSCIGCLIPLVLYEQAAAREGQQLTNCPSCQRQLSAPASIGTPGTATCPKCSSVIYDGETTCGGCGALIDFSLPAGSIQTDTIETTTYETVWSSSYGYTSYGWLNPWDPYADALAFGFLFYDPWYY